jgi:hypothetical protein
MTIKFSELKTPEEKALMAKAEFARREKKFQDYLRSPVYQEKLRLRLKINDACDRKAEARGATWNLCARPDNKAEGCIFFIENFGYTFDPRPQSKPNHLPFILFEYQKELIRWLIDHIESGTDGLVEKSRDMGMSWVIFVWVTVWYWNFNDGINLLIGSYKEALVDNRTKDSLFGMIDYAVESLPKWLLPKGFRKDKHRTQMKLVNPVNNNLIAGDTMNPEFGRGTRKTAILFDELGTWDYAKDAWEGCGDSTTCRIANSTPKGYNYYAMLRDSGIDVGTFHWSMHPLKDEAWYEFECQRRTPEAVAQELDISYNKSQEGRVYYEWNDTYVSKGQYPYDPDLNLYVGWDFGKTDDTALVWVQIDPSTGRLRVLDAYKNTGKNIDFYVPIITGILPSDGYKYSQADLDIIDRHKNWKIGTHFGDPAGRFQNQVSNETVITVLKANGILVNFRDEWKEFNVRKTAVRDYLLDGIELNLNEETKWFDHCLAQASYPKVRSQGVEEIRSQKPKHDYTSHYRSSFEYLCLGLRDTVKSRYQKVYDRYPKKNRPSGSRRKVTGY